MTDLRGKGEPITAAVFRALLNAPGGLTFDALAKRFVGRGCSLIDLRSAVFTLKVQGLAVRAQLGSPWRAIVKSGGEA